MKGKDVAKKGEGTKWLGDFANHWDTCPQCKREYQQELATDMSDNLLAFVKSKDYTHADRYHDLFFLVALDKKGKVFEARANAGGVVGVTKELKLVANQMIDVIDEQVKKRFHSSFYLHYEARAYDYLATVIMFKHAYMEALNASNKDMDESQEMRDYRNKDYEVALKYLKKSRDLYRADGDADSVKSQNLNIDMMRSKIERKSVNAEDGLQISRNMYAHVSSFSEGDEGSEALLHQAAELAHSLQKALHMIEAERLLKKTLPTCVRVHGADHDLTKQVETLLALQRAREVGLKSREGYFSVVGYEGGEYLVRATGKGSGEDAFAVGIDEVVMRPGTIVLCHGLKTASHLNGKIGEIRAICEENGRFEVYFEDKALAPCRVRQDNLRVLIDLPDCE